jgi:hypothetical protein
MVMEPVCCWGLSGAGASVIMVLEPACCLRSGLVLESGAGACLALGPLWFWCQYLPADLAGICLVLEGACMVLEPFCYWSLSGAGGAFLLLEPVWRWGLFISGAGTCLLLEVCCLRSGAGACLVLGPLGSGAGTCLLLEV